MFLRLMFIGFLYMIFFWLQEGGKYGELFHAALKNYGILCIGLYRFRDTNSSVRTPSSKRYVITNPPDDFPLLPTDQVSRTLSF
jgi:potassium large conductance calcium-activated channel subfamily M alpha protein 1